MKRHLLTLVACVGLAVSTKLPAQEVPKFPEPVKEHQWLKQFVGQWESESEAMAGPGQEPMKCKGTMSSRMLGGFWVISDMTGDLGGVNMTAVQTIGYDAEKKKLPKSDCGWSEIVSRVGVGPSAMLANAAAIKR